MYSDPTKFQWGFFMFESISLSGPFDTKIAAQGTCGICGSDYAMNVGYAAQYVERLFETLTRKKRIDFAVSDDEADPRLSTDYLWGDARGQMFGILVVRNSDGETGLLKAFSGQYNGIWEVDGWVPPLIDVSAFERVTAPVERLIKRIGSQIEAMPKGSPGQKKLIGKRKILSQALMKDIHAMYMVPNKCGDVRSLPEIVTGEGGIPTGTGDCCAPKLLGYAAKHSLIPLGLAEFYVGKENKSGTRKHGGVYAACKEKCERIMGYLLCEECRP